MHANNPKDPLRLISSEHQRVLFQKFGVAATGFQVEDAIGAALNVLINALRQTYDTKQKAETRFDELAGKTRQLLVDHYDGTGRRKQGTFPFNQTLHVNLHTDIDKIMKQ